MMAAAWMIFQEEPVQLIRTKRRTVSSRQEVPQDGDDRAAENQDNAHGDDYELEAVGQGRSTAPLAAAFRLRSVRWLVPGLRALLLAIFHSGKVMFDACPRKRLSATMFRCLADAVDSGFRGVASSSLALGGRTHQGRLVP